MWRAEAASEKVRAQLLIGISARRHTLLWVAMQIGAFLPVLRGSSRPSTSVTSLGLICIELAAFQCHLCVTLQLLRKRRCRARAESKAACGHYRNDRLGPTPRVHEAFFRQASAGNRISFWSMLVAFQRVQGISSAPSRYDDQAEQSGELDRYLRLWSQ